MTLCRYPRRSENLLPTLFGERGRSRTRFSRVVRCATQADDDAVWSESLQEMLSEVRRSIVGRNRFYDLYGQKQRLRQASPGFRSTAGSRHRHKIGMVRLRANKRLMHRNNLELVLPLP
jgi:hypothetical protein